MIFHIGITYTFSLLGIFFHIGITCAFCLLGNFYTESTYAFSLLGIFIEIFIAITHAFCWLGIYFSFLFKRLLMLVDCNFFFFYKDYSCFLVCLSCCLSTGIS